MLQAYAEAWDLLDVKFVVSKCRLHEGCPSSSSAEVAGWWAKWAGPTHTQLTTAGQQARQ
jgi:hypothetical protein